jgi:toxin-antitoxin system PIN domain toxin
MQLVDVNILVYAHRSELPQHERYSRWLTELATSSSPFALSESVLQGFVRVVTNPKIFRPASTLDQAFRFIDALLTRPTCTLLRPGPNHWAIFRRLCVECDARAKLAADAAHAAIAIEHGCEWVSADTDFARFVPLLRFRRL